MYSSNQLPWMNIHEFLLNAGNVREPKEFCVQAIRKIYALIPYDQARIYFVNDSGKICDQVLMGVDQHWSDVYLDYYSRIENGRYAIPNRRYALPARIKNGHYLIPELEGGVYDWTDYECDEFFTDYIKPQGLRHSAGFGFHNADSFTRSVYSLDRTSRSGYTREEIDMMTIIHPHLDNLYKNLSVLALRNTFIQYAGVQKPLTRRELEIAELLCSGLTPIKISNQLCLSLPTVYKHIANIHTKLDVSNRQELLLKLMNPQAASRN